MSRVDNTKIAANGLRYKSKEGGSPFGESRSAATMSCFMCGRHKPRSQGSFKSMLNKSMFFCGECKPKELSVPVKHGT